MKIEVLKEHLESAVTTAARVSNKNLSLPVLGCVVIHVEQGRITLKSTNLDVSVEINLKGKIFEDGVVAVPSAILTQTVSTATDQKITIETEGTTLVVKGARGSAHIKTVDTSDFPTLPFVKEGQGVSVVLSAKELIRALKSVVFSASSSGMRPELSSVFITVDDGFLITAATDSFRLAEMRIPVRVKTSLDPILIPQRNIPDIIRLLHDADTVELRRSDTQITLLVNGSYLTSRTIEGVFPDYQTIIPKEFETSLTLLTEDARKAFRKVSVFVDASNQTTLRVDPEKNIFSIRAANTQVGETEEVLEGVVEGNPISITFNGRYISDALGVVTTDSVVFKIAGPGKPMVIGDLPDNGFTYLVMPMNT